MEPLTISFSADPRGAYAVIEPVVNRDLYVLEMSIRVPVTSRSPNACIAAVQAHAQEILGKAELTSDSSGIEAVGRAFLEIMAKTPLDPKRSYQHV